MNNFSDISGAYYRVSVGDAWCEKLGRFFWETSYQCTMIVKADVSENSAPSSFSQMFGVKLKYIHSLGFVHVGYR